MNEKLDLKEGFRIFNGKESELDTDLVKQADIPKCSDPAILQQTVLAGQNKMFKVPTELMNLFLNNYFGINGIYSFMKIYSKLHAGIEFAMPVPETIYYLFGYENNPEVIKKLLTGYQASVGVMGGSSTFLNLHTNDIYKLTIIAAGFDLECIDSPFLGYHYKNKNFHFVIKSSSQMDLTILYNNLRKEGVLK